VLSGDLESLRRDALPPFAAAVAAGTAAIMSGHLLAPAVDDVPATVSRRWLTEILRGELDFTGVIVTDALEMAGVADLYGIPGAAVRSLAAGADLLCIGGETRPEAEIDAIRDAIVDAVLDGTLPEERLAEAAERCRTVGLAAARRAADPSARPGSDADGRESLSIALRATQTAGPLPALRQPILVVRCTDTPNIAVGVVPWGPAAALGAREILLRDGDAIPVEDINAAGSVLVVTRDRHRFPWMVRKFDAMRTMRPDAVLIEMGITGVSDVDAPAIATFGATQANTRAIVQLLSATASPA
jgi:beta-N-acetylhexosaminidase